MPIVSAAFRTQFRGKIAFLTMIVVRPRYALGAKRAARDGFIVVVVLWVLAALSSLASIYSVYVVNTAAGFAVYDEQLRAKSLVSAALELTAYQQLSQQSHLTSGQFNFEFGEANIAVRFRSEAARIDLNAAPKELLAGLFRVLGAESADADKYSNRVVAWRTNQPNDPNPEAAAYEMARAGYQPRGAKFPHPNELSLVRGLTASLVERALPFVTVYSGRPQINVLDAMPEVLAALPGMTPADLKTFLAQREVAPDKAKTLLPNEAQQFVSFEGGKAIRVFVQVAFDTGHKESAEVVILILENGEQPYAILSWQDGSNQMVADGRP